MLTDHDLLIGGVADQVVENAAGARRWARLVELHRRSPDTDGDFAMSAREWAALEASESWAMSAGQARAELNRALFLSTHLAQVWDLCLAGSLDRYRAVTIADLVRQRLSDPDDYAVLARRLAPFLRKHLTRHGELDAEVVTCTITQLRNKLNYEIRRLLDEGDFERQFEERSVAITEFDDGMAALGITSSVDEVRLARHRLRHAAREARRQGDPRTVNQLMSDLALDLLIGRADELPVPRFARPVINVTVSLETLAGLRDDPGQLSGGTVIPAALARAIATKEGATWFRLLTDPDGHVRELSTKSYQPTTTIWRHVVATRPTCAHPMCDRPSVECELDHEVPWPGGPTDTANLQPLCRFHHKAKHARALLRPEIEWELGLAG